MSILAVIGKPISHSLSPILHSYAARLVGLRVLSFRCELEPEMLGPFTRTVRLHPEFAGFNVTMPYKSQIMAHLDEIDPVASKLGAVNTVANRGGRLLGYNTDWLALRGAIASRGSGYTRALIVGAGGAAAAAVYGLLNPKPLVKEVYVYNRSRQRLEALKAAFPEVLEGKLEGGYELLVNATPQPITSILSEPLTAKLVADFPYTHYHEGLAQRLSELGVCYIDGLELLARQGVGAMKLFLGVDVDHHPVYLKLKAEHLKSAATHTR